MRHKVAYGGRGAGRSWNFGRQHIIDMASQKLRILFCREIQSSIKESVHKLLSDQIEACGFGGQFDINDRSITCPRSGSEAIFEGLYRNVNRIKSLEGIDRADVEEAEAVTEQSWDILTPTIRKPGSEIWVRFNPQYEDDATYKRFVTTPPDNCVSRLINFDQNPYFPEVLEIERLQDLARDPVLYEHKWLGKPHGSGRKVWTGFDKAIHVREFSMEQIAKIGNCYMAMDPHSHYYPFCTWFAIIPKNERMRWPEDFHKHVYAEYPTFEDLGGYYHDLRNKVLFKDSLLDLSRSIQSKDGIEFGIQVKDRFMDTRYAKGAGSWNSSTATDGIVALLAKPENGGLVFHLPKEKDLSEQRKVIHADMLWNRNVQLSSFNEPSFSVSPRCKNVIASLMNHRLEEDSEVESDKYKDPSDTLRIGYAGFNKLGYTDPNQYQEAKRLKPVAVNVGRGYWGKG